jgi:hypothetical protein
MYTFARQIYYSCSLLIYKLNDLKVIYDLYSQYLTQILSKMTSFTKPVGVQLCNHDTNLINILCSCLAYIKEDIKQSQLITCLNSLSFLLCCPSEIQWD